MALFCCPGCGSRNLDTVMINGVYKICCDDCGCEIDG